MAIQCALDFVVVKVKTKYIKNFSKVMKLAAIQNNTSIEPADTVNIVGEVVSVPKGVSSKIDHKGFSIADIRVGDTAIFSKNVIFNFASTEPHEEPIFKNRVWYQGEEYFLCDIIELFAVVRDGEIRMQNGYLMVENLDPKPVIYVHANTKRSIRSAQALVTQIGRPLENQKAINVERGDLVFYRPSILQLYQINDRPFGILRQRDILGRGVMSYSAMQALN